MYFIVRICSSVFAPIHGLIFFTVVNHHKERLRIANRGSNIKLIVCDSIVLIIPEV